MHQDEWRGLLYFDVVGNRSRLTYREMRYVLTGSATLAFLLLSVVLLVLMDTHGYRSSMPVLKTAILWYVCVVTLTSLYVAFTSLSMEISKRFPGFFVYFPIIGFLSMSINTFVTVCVAAYLAGVAVDLSVGVSHLVTNLALGLVFESLFMIVVLPRLQMKSNKVTENEPRNFITIAGENIGIDQILLITSQDHYIEVETLTSKRLLRARLTDVAAQISEDIGIMPHRSHWVALSAIERFENSSKSKSLILKNGRTVPVARGRIEDVRNWLNQ